MSVGSAPRLRARALCFQIGANSIVDRLDMEVNRGQVLGLIGPNGAGKTTAIDLLSGFSPPSSGSVFLDGVDITRLAPDRRVRRGLARTFQESPTVPDMRVREHVQLAIESCSPRGRISRANELLDSVGLADAADEPADALVIGDRRMLDLARAIATQPVVLLLDEPFAGLSATQEKRLSELIRTLVSKQASVVIIEHRLRLLDLVADTVLALAQGRCLAAGSLESVLAKPAVRDAYLARPNPAEHLPNE